MDILALLIAFLPAIMECINKDGEANVTKRLRRAGPAIQFTIYREGVKSGLSRKDARQQAKDTCDDLREASDEELAFLLSEAKNGLIKNGLTGN